MRAFRRTAVLAWLIPAALLAGLLVPEAVKASRSEGGSRAEGSVLSAAETPDEAAAEEERRIRGEADRMLAEMTLEEKVAQLFFVTPEALTGVSPVTVTGQTSKAAFDQRPVGGLIYFQQNLRSPEQVRAMLFGIRSYAEETSGIPLFTGVDEEGGSVLRIGSDSAFGVKRTPAMALVGASGEAAVRSASAYIGSYLKDLGFTLDFAPCADVITNPANKVIGNRSFGSDPAVVAAMAAAYADGLHQSGVMSVYKHFPGHGGTEGDTHEGYAYTERSLAELAGAELVPFAGAEGRGADMIMAAHICAPGITGDSVPASLSPFMINDLLRTKLNYGGVVITDALNMGAVTAQYSSAEAAVLALEAGCDMLLMPEDFDAAYDGVTAAVRSGRISEERIDESVRRILKLKLLYRLK